MRKKQYKTLAFGSYLRSVIGMDLLSGPVKTSLGDLIQKGLMSLYLKDTGKFGSPPTKNAFWGRASANIDARTAQGLESTGLVAGRTIKNGIFSELQLTAKGVAEAKKVLGV